MAIFRFRALQSDGTISEGSIEAGGRQQAYVQLEQRGLTPVAIDEHAKAGDGESRFHFSLRRKRVPFQALERFTRELSSLLAAGIPLSRALKIQYKEASVETAKRNWKGIHDLVVDGSSLADAMAQYPETFPKVYVAMVHAGETGGFLDLVLEQIAEFQTRDKDLRAKVTSALIYPSVLLGLAVCVLIYLMVFFIPRFQLIFKGFGGSLPALTLAIVGVSRFMRIYGLFVAMGILVAVVLVKRWKETGRGKRVWERLTLRLPIVGPLVAQIAMARFCRMLGTLLKSGVPLINALTVARKSIINQTLVDTLERSIERIKQGDRLAVGLSDCKSLFPESVLEMISIAEETGRLDHELLRISGVAEADLDRRLKTAVSLAEPLMLFLMAGFIGTIFIGMLIPIFSIQEYIK